MIIRYLCPIVGDLLPLVRCTITVGPVILFVHHLIFQYFLLLSELLVYFYFSFHHFSLLQSCSYHTKYHVWNVEALILYSLLLYFMLKRFLSNCWGFYINCVVCIWAISMLFFHAYKVKLSMQWALAIILLYYKIFNYTNWVNNLYIILLHTMSYA